MRIRLAVLAITMLVVAGCGASVPGTPGTGSTTAGSTAGSTTGTGPTTVATTAGSTTTESTTADTGTSTSITDSGSDHDLGAGVGWHGDDQAELHPFSAGTSTGTSGCRLQTAQIIRDDRIVNLSLPTPECAEEAEQRQIINGFHGVYLAVPKGATVTKTGDMPTGALVQFSQAYSEYTNSRTDFVDQVGLISLKKPLSGGAQVIMLVVTSKTDNSASADLVYQIAASLFIH